MIQSIRPILVGILAGLLAVGCGGSKPPTNTGTTGSTAGTGDGTGTGDATVDDLAQPPKEIKTTLEAVGLNPALMDTSIDPCDDFFKYACGGWLAKAEIPADRSLTDQVLKIIERNEAVLKEILETSRRADANEVDAQTTQLGTFYGACMDEEAVEKAGVSGIAPLLQKIRSIRNTTGLVGAIGELHRHAIFAPFEIGVLPDFKDSTMNILHIDSAGLGLPDRDYYLKDEKTLAEKRKFYEAHVQRVFVLAGYKKRKAAVAASDVMKLETELAKVTLSGVERRNPLALYNIHDRAQLDELAPTMKWKSYFATLGIASFGKANVTTPAFLKRLDELLTGAPIRQWKNYLTWHLLHETAPTLPKKFADEDFALRAALRGLEAQKPRWKRCVTATTAAMGENLGRKYVDRMFGGNSKQAAERLVREISAAFAVELEKLQWMDRETKEQARRKLAMMSYLIGFPDKWKTYDFEVSAGAYSANALRAAAFNLGRELAKADKKVDRKEWFLPPQIVNAFYNPLSNQMTFPAGILQPPIFGADRSIAANLGGIGMVAGHELTHGFDDAGAMFDGEGNLRNWWQPKDAEQFKARGRCLVDQYNQFRPIPAENDLTVNGELTLGENIADLAGIKLAYYAYKKLRAGSGEKIIADGLSEDQLFFLGVGQAWCSKVRPDEIRRRIIIDPHSPPEFRVNGSLRNLPEFGEVFRCQPGAPMRPADTCSIW